MVEIKTQDAIKEITSNLATMPENAIHRIFGFCEGINMMKAGGSHGEGSVQHQGTGEHGVSSSKH